MKVLAVVPARCGSKGFPNKNIKEIEGKTLLEWAIKIGLDCSIIDDIYISTDCKKYENIAISAGAKSLGLRPRKLASDTAKSIDVIIDLLDNLEKKYDYVVLLQPTSPVRQGIDIENMLKSIEENNSSSAVSVCEFEEPHPFKLKTINDKGYIKSFIDGTSSEVPRQSLPKAYALNGAIYITKVKTILEEKTFLPDDTIPYIMNNNINIDSEEDFIFLEAMIKKQKVNFSKVIN